MAKKSKSESYWEQRSIELEAAWQKKCRETVEKELAAYYKQALHHIQQDIEALYGTYAKDNAVTMAEARKILQGNEYRVWRMDMQEYINEIRRISETEGMTKSSQLLKELNTLAMRSRITRLDKLYSETLLELGRLAGKTGKSMDKFLSEAYKDGYYHNLYEIGKKTWLKSTPAKVDSSQVMNVLRTPWSGKNYSQRIWNNNAKLGKTVKETIEQGIHRGSSVAKLSKQVAERMDVGTRDASRLVRTELNFVQNRAALESIKDAGMEFFRFVATLDSRTSQQCRSHDGHVYPIDEASPGENMPPLHARCRSTICASLGAEDSHGGRRIARNEDGKKFRVPTEMRYGEWKAVYIDKSKTWEEWAKEIGYKGKEMHIATPSGVGSEKNVIIKAKEEFVPAKTIKEADSYAMNTLGIPKASYKGCDLDTANAWNEGLKDSFERFPELKKNFGFVGGAHNRNTGMRSVIYQFLHDNIIKNNPNFTLEQLLPHIKRATNRELRKYAISANTYAQAWQPSGIYADYRGVVVNERFGKNSDDFIKRLQRDITNRLHPVGCETIRSVLDHEIGHMLDNLLEISKLPEAVAKIDSLTNEEITNNLSRYAWNNKNKNPHREFIAEAWSEYCNNPTPRPLAKFIGELIEREYNRRFT